MNILQLIACMTTLLTTTTLAAPGERIDVRDLKNKVSLTLGTKGTIQGKQEGDTLSAPTLAKEAEAKQPGIAVEFKKEAEFLALKLTNGLPKALRYRAAIRIKGRKDYVETSLILPVMPGIFSYETWQDPIEELVLFDFKLTDEKQ